MPFPNLMLLHAGSAADVPPCADAQIRDLAPGAARPAPGSDWRAGPLGGRGAFAMRRARPLGRASVAPRRDTQIGREIYGIDEATGARIALAAIIAATR